MEQVNKKILLKFQEEKKLLQFKNHFQNIFFEIFNPPQNLFCSPLALLVQVRNNLYRWQIFSKFAIFSPHSFFLLCKFNWPLNLFCFGQNSQNTTIVVKMMKIRFAILLTASQLPYEPFLLFVRTKVMLLHNSAVFH